MPSNKHETLNAPMFHWFGQHLPTLPFSFFRIRWQLSRPFQTTVLPKSFAIPFLKSLLYLTYGETFLVIPLVILLVAACYITFHNPDARTSGNVASFGLVLVVLTANKTNSIFSLVLGIPFDRLIGYHKLAACCTLILTILHALAAKKDDAARGINPTTPSHFPQDEYTSGFLIAAALALLIMTSFFSFFRRRFFDAWLTTHIVLIIAVVVTCYFHSANIVVIVAVWWLMDVIFRYFVMASCIYPTTATLRKLRPDVIEIRFTKPRGFHYNPGQFLRIAIPKLSVLQFHPFSISSAPHEKEVTLHSRASGNWTQQLLQLAAEEGGNDIKIWMEGPYGIVGVDLDSERYRMVLCVSGGIGVTHCRSVARSLLHDHHATGRKLDQLRFVWAVRDYALVKDLPLFGDNEDHGTTGSIVETSDVFMPQAEVYLTSSRDRGDGGDVENVESHVHDQQPVVQKGRPDLDKILTEMKDEAVAQGITHIAVFGCGPQSLIDALKEACREHSKRLMDSEGVYFDLHVEVFEF